MIRTRVIPSGEFMVSSGKKEVLEAHLGTCVGLTLVDRTSHVGGLAHFLLSGPIGSDPGWKPACFASTGMPLFLQKMLEAGGKKGNLEAVMGGGALLGPISQLDLSLDIGGRTAEWLTHFFEREQIPLRHQETGGLYTCRIRLDLSTFNTTIDQIEENGETGDQMLPVLTWDAIDQRIERLHPIPQVVLKLIRKIDGELYNLNEIVRELEQDQVLSARILKLCNSPLFPVVRNIDSLPQAVALLGGMYLRRLAITSAMDLVCDTTWGGYSLCRGGIFQHAMGTAQAARRMAAFTRALPPDLAYTAGLLHDIGKVVLDQHMAGQHPFFYRAMQTSANDLCTVESLRFGMNHTETGERLAQKWGLPANLAAAIHFHHNPESAGIHLPLVTIIYLADLLMSRFQVGLEIDRLSTDRLSERLKVLGLSLSQFSQLAEIAFQKLPDE